MATDFQTSNDPSVTSLVSGILDDAQHLLKQQAELLKADLRKDLREAKEVGYSFAIGGSLLAAGGMLLLFMLAYLLSWAIEGLPLWGSFGIVGGLLAVAGGLVLYRGQERLENLNPLPEQSAEALKENLQWKTNPR